MTMSSSKPVALLLGDKFPDFEAETTQVGREMQIDIDMYHMAIMLALAQQVRSTESGLLDPYGKSSHAPTVDRADPAGAGAGAWWYPVVVRTFFRLQRMRREKEVHAQAAASRSHSTLVHSVSVSVSVSLSLFLLLSSAILRGTKIYEHQTCVGQSVRLDSLHPVYKVPLSRNQRPHKIGLVLAMFYELGWLPMKWFVRRCMVNTCPTRMPRVRGSGVQRTFPIGNGFVKMR